MIALGILVLVLSGVAALTAVVNFGHVDGDRKFALAALALCMAGLIAARWML